MMIEVSHLSPKQKSLLAMDKRLKVAKLVGANPEGMTSTEVAEKLDMTEAQVKYAMNNLISLGEVEVVYRRTGRDAGRVKVSKALEDCPDGLTIGDVTIRTGLTKEQAVAVLDSMRCHGEAKETYRKVKE